MDRRHALLRAGKRPREPAVGIAIFHTGPPVRRRDNFPWAPAGREKFRSRYAEESTLLAAKGAGLKIDFCKSPRLRDFGVLIGFIEGGKGPYEVTALKSTQKWKKYSATRPIFL